MFNQIPTINQAISGIWGDLYWDFHERSDEERLVIMGKNFDALFTDTEILFASLLIRTEWRILKWKD